MKVLVVEDETRISSFIAKGLSENGFAVDLASDGVKGLEMASTCTYDAILLDIMLPGRDGLSVLREVRAARNNVPVVLLTARDSIADRVEGLNQGADDYVTKPFFIEELIARIHAVTRRLTGGAVSTLATRGVILNRMSHDVHVGQSKVALTAREYSLLELLMRAPGTVYTRTQILEKVWEYHFDPQTNIIEVYIQRLRARLADAGVTDLIETVRGVGYRVRPDSEA